jgi:hypothetical protein
MIPRLIHRLWLGPKPMPERYVEYGQQWADMNPGWTVTDWNQDTLPVDWLRNANVWDRIETEGVNPGAWMPQDQAVAVQRADVAGYEIVYTHGGIYLNCDIQPVRPLEPWIDDVVGDRAFSAFEDQKYLVNAVMGGPKRHPFWRTVIDKLEPRYNRFPGYMMNIVTGPYLLTETYWEWKDDSTFYAAPRDVFNPIHHGEIPAGSYVTDFDLERHPTTIGVHHWGHRLTA